jgi:hypothetical protein
MSFIIKVDGLHTPSGVRVDNRQVIVGKCRARGGGGEIHVVLSQQDLSLQVEMKGHASAALTGHTATFADPFPQQELPGIPTARSQ